MRIELGSVPIVLQKPHWQYHHLKKWDWKHNCANGNMAWALEGYWESSFEMEDHLKYLKQSASRRSVGLMTVVLIIEIVVSMFGQGMGASL
jgi:hypothetical protein